MFDELSLHLLDIAMNSLAAGARTIAIAVVESRRHDWLIVRVRDDGHGMDEKTLQEALERNASTKRSRKRQIGLGLALLRQTSEMCGGTFSIRSAPGKGTTVTASMRLNHVDRPPVGDLNSTILTLSAAGPEVDVQFDYCSDNEKFHFSSQESTAKEKVCV
jgi:signal transduction histidine kinase